jgi:type II secretory pathway component HofQ
MELFLIRHGEAKSEKHPRNAAFLLILLVSLVFSAVSRGALPDEPGKEKDKKKQTQSSQAGESKNKLEPKPEAEPLPKSGPGPKSENKRFQQTIIADEPKKYTGEPGTFMFHEADLKDVLLFFGKTYKLNIVIDPGVSGKVTLHLVNVPWDQALDLILRQHGLAMLKDGNLITAKELKK